MYGLTMVKIVELIKIFGFRAASRAHTSRAGQGRARRGSDAVVGVSAALEGVGPTRAVQKTCLKLVWWWVITLSKGTCAVLNKAKRKKQVWKRKKKEAQPPYHDLMEEDGSPTSLGSQSSQCLAPSIPGAESSKLHKRAVATTIFPIRITRRNTLSFISAPSSGDR